MNNESIRSFNDTRSPYSYKASAFIDMDLRQYGRCDTEYGILYEINDANPTQVQPYGFLRNPSCFQILKAYFPTKHKVISEDISRSLKMSKKT